jgi:hypothetical protein
LVAKTVNGQFIYEEPELTTKRTKLFGPVLRKNWWATKALKELAGNNGVDVN